MLNMPATISTCRNDPCKVVKLTVIRIENLAQNDPEELKRNTSLIDSNFTFVGTHLNLQRF